MRDDARLDQARAMPIEEIAERLGIDGLTRVGRERIGPCPTCGGRDRFAINTAKGVFQCRQCGAAGDAIALVRWQLGLDLRGGLDWMCGPAVDLDDQARDRRRTEAKARRARADAAAARERDRAIAGAREIWDQGIPAEGTLVRAYLHHRGIGPDLLPVMPSVLRYHPALRYMVSEGGRWVEVHCGPAMLAAVQQPDGSVSGVHRTWLAPDGRGKAVLSRGDEKLPAKKTLGSVKGGAIRLAQPSGPWSVLVMAEGIETTLSALVAGATPGAAHWSGVSLGNLSGVMRKAAGVRWSGEPDLDDDAAFVPPPWVQDFVLVEDGDSSPAMTRARLMSCARRAMIRVPGLRSRIVPCPSGKDLNDVLMEGRDDD